MRVIDECHRAHPEKAIMLVEKKNQCWSGMSCLDMAAEAKDRVRRQYSRAVHYVCCFIGSGIGAVLFFYMETL